MKILFCVRHNFYDAPGGAQIQILKTKEYLEKLGVFCEITTTPYNIDYSKYDILHLTDLTWVYDNIVYLKEIKKQDHRGKKILSTIYWPFDDYASNGAPFLQKMIFKVFGVNGFEFVKAFAKFIIKKESIYLNGLKKNLEMQALDTRLDLNLTNFSIVNNAIDTKKNR